MSTAGTVAGGGAVAAPSRRRPRQRGEQGVPAAGVSQQRRDGGASYVYEARRPIKVGQRVYAPGEELEATLVESWPRWEGYIRTGKLVRRRVFGR